MNTPTPELSHPIRLDKIGSTAVTITLAPNESVRARLAERFQLEALDDFKADVTVERRRDTGLIEVSGRLTASVVQSCVVTTDPVSATVHTDFLELFDDSGEMDPETVELDPLADDPEPVEGDTLDVGEIAVQAFGLALDPYPRRPDAQITTLGTDEKEGDGDGQPQTSPFAKLAVLKGRPVKKG